MNELKKEKPEEIKISNNQLFSLAACGAIGGTIIVVSSLLASIAKQDAWITALITPACGLGVICLYYYLGKQYPDKTIIGIVKQIFGKWMGIIVSVCYVFFFIQISYHITWHMGDFVCHYYHETPEYIIYGILVVGMVIAVLYGLEAFARASEIFLKIMSFFFFLAIILLLPKIDVTNLLPVLENGILPSLKAAVFMSAFSIFTLQSLLMIFPANSNDLPRAGKAFGKGFLWGSLIVFIATIMSIMVLGSNISARTVFPTFLLFKEIDIAGIFTRLEFVIAIIWIISEFMINLMFFYAAVKALAEFLKLKDYRKIVLPLGLINLVMSGITFPDTIYQVNWNSIVWTPYAATFGLFIPLIMLLVLGLKKMFSRRRQKERGKPCI